MLNVLEFSLKLNSRKYVKIKKGCDILFYSCAVLALNGQVFVNLKLVFPLEIFVFLYNLSACPCIWSAVHKLTYSIKNVLFGT